MKITTINSQNHKGSSYMIGRLLAERLTDADNITEFFLPGDLNHFCLGCYTCIENERECLCRGFCKLPCSEGEEIQGDCKV